MSTTITSKRLSAVLAFIVAFAVAAVMAISPAAFAVETVTDPTPKVGNIDPATEGSLIVHKYISPIDGTEAHDGSALSGSALPDESRKLSGVEFKIYAVNGIDLTKQAGWDTLKKIQEGLKASPATVTIAANGALSGDGLPSGVSLANVAKDTQTTNDGEATFSQLPVGAYVVVETNNDNATIKKNGTSEKIKVVNKVDPFIVTIPFPTTKNGKGKNVDGAQNGWLYTVNVYPKNDVSDKISKKLVATDETRLIAGDGELNWQISVPIPTATKDLDKFVISDTLEKSTTLSTTHKPVLKIESTVIESSKYTVTGGTSASDNTVLITFTDFAALNAAKGKKVTVDLFVTVPAGTIADNVIPNTDYKVTYHFVGEPDDHTTTPPPEVPTPKAYFGDYNLFKKSSVGDKELAGAKFELYKTCTDAATSSNKLQTGELKSDDQGIVAIHGLFRGATDDATKTYCLKEIEAPAGFKLNATPQEITVTKNTGAVSAHDGDFVNTPRETGDVPELPLTGAAGKVLLTLGGIAIVMLAAGTVLATRRRKA